MSMDSLTAAGNMVEPAEGVTKKADKNGKDIGIISRPNASQGFWLCVLIPLSYIVANWQLPYSSLTFEYKLTTVVAFGLFLQSAVIFVTLVLEPRRLFALAFGLLPSLFTAFLVYACLGQTETVSIFWGAGSNIFYRYVYMKMLRSLPKSFSIGEATIASQGLVLFLLNALLQIPRNLLENPTTDFLEMNAIMIEALLCLAVATWLLYIIKWLRNVWLFYPLMVLLVVVVCIIPVTHNPPVVTLFLFITSDLKRVFVLISYFGFVGMTIATVSWRLTKSEKASTSTRKIFHLLIVGVYIPGFLFQCTLLYIASGVCLAFLVVFEIFRVARIPPFGETFTQSVDAFVDEKDAGIVALTPFYLLVGCSLPMWIAPCPCELTDSVGNDLLPMLAGVLSIGIGDTAAGIIGSNFGRHKWPNSKKTYEGTIASILSQIATVYALYFFKFNILTEYKALSVVAAIVITSIVEALTDQIDNIVLPLVFFIISSCA